MQHTLILGHEKAVDQPPRASGMRGFPLGLAQCGPSTYLMRSMVSEYTVYADLAELSDSVAVPHSIKDRTASKYL